MNVGPRYDSHKQEDGNQSILNRFVTANVHIIIFQYNEVIILHHFLDCYVSKMSDIQLKTLFFFLVPEKF